MRYILLSGVNDQGRFKLELRHTLAAMSSAADVIVPFDIHLSAKSVSTAAGM